MTPEQQAAFIIAQAACANGTIAAMQAQNECDRAAGKPPTNSPQDFEDVAARYGIHHNAVLGFFR